MSADFRVFAEEAVAWMREQSARTQSEVYLQRTRERSLSRRDGARECIETAESLGAGVRVARDGHLGFASAGRVDLESLKSLWARAVEQSSYAGARAGRGLSSPVSGEDDARLAASLWDESLFARSWEDLDERLLGAESAASLGGRARVLRSEIVERRAEVVIASTSGVLSSGREGAASISVSASSGDGSQTQTGDGYRSARRFEALDGSAAGAEAARRALAGAGARRARTGSRAVVFEPWVGAEFLELLADLVSAEEVQGGRSLLGGRLGNRVASALVTLRDDARLLGGLGSACFDDEGVPTRDKAIIDRGTLVELLHDFATATRESAVSNGCGYREGWDSTPSPSPSNFHLVPGPGSRESLIADTKDGVLILEVLGMHMVDPVSGEFSIGVSGLEISSGQIARPFKGAMLAGNLLELLARVDAVASDLSFYGGYGSPTFRVCALDLT